MATKSTKTIGLFYVPAKESLGGWMPPKLYRRSEGSGFPDDCNFLVLPEGAKPNEVRFLRTRARRFLTNGPEDPEDLQRRTPTYLLELPRNYTLKRLLSAQHHAKPNEALVPVAKELAIKHAIENTEAHQQLVQSLRRMHAEFLRKGAFYEPSMTARGLTSWKLARRKLSTLADKLESISAELMIITRDQVMRSAIRKVDGTLPGYGWSRFDNSVRSLLELSRVIGKAAEIGGKKGNRRIPRWTNDAARTCRDFWRQHMKEEPTHRFKREHTLASNATTEPSNAFSRWFCDVMETLCDFTRSECETILNRKPLPGDSARPRR